MKEDLDKLGHHISPNPTNFYGSLTEDAVRDFQRRYGLRENGIGDPVTLAKIEHLLTAPLSNGMFRYDVVDLKVNLGILGFGVSNNPTIFFGPVTERSVREFQQYYGLQVTGVANNETQAKISEILASPFRIGQRHRDTIQLKIDLGRLGFPVSSNPTTLYGSQTEQAVRQFQAQNGLRVNGIADEVTLKKMADLLANIGPVITFTDYSYTLNHMVSIQMQRRPRISYTRPNFISYVASDFIDLSADGQIGTVNTTTLNVRFEPNTTLASVGTLSQGMRVTVLGTEPDTNPSSSRVWYAIAFNHGDPEDPGFQFARQAEVRRHVDPNRFTLDPSHRDMYQFLDLREASGVQAEYLNENLLRNRGTLHGQGAAFSEGAHKYNLNEFYLISHARLETGNGTSSLANGSIRVGEISTNRWVSIQPQGTFIAERRQNGNTWTWTYERNDNFDLSQARNIRTVYNMFGIDAIDGQANTRGSIHAYREGWFTPSIAIVEGTKFIAERYVHHPTRQQNTLYKMRWNPANPGTLQYATDVGWAVKQANMIAPHYQNLDYLKATFDIPRFRN
ncbi:MAG: peptidoglycan-binding protein [Bacillaceae bacterium]|nr:peptidoglycan-binding protein [Bacillaceae bacterium]